jgi:hypothetical protein
MFNGKGELKEHGDNSLTEATKIKDRAEQANNMSCTRIVPMQIVAHKKKKKIEPPETK